MYAAKKACRLFFALSLSALYLLSPLALIYSALPENAFAQTTIGNGTIVATPASGNVPLNVSLTATWLDVTKTYTINFGDGATVSASPQCATDSATSQRTGCTITASHIYTKASTYIASLGGYSAKVIALPATSGKTPPGCNITVSPSTISVGGTVTVKWTSVNATDGAITNIGNVAPAGSIQLLPNSNQVTTYIGAFNGPGGTANCQATVNVTTSSGSSGSSASSGAAPAPTASPTPVTPASSPSIVGSGLVPCGYGNFDNNATHSGSTGCQACDIPVLIQNLITFAIGLSIPIAAALFAWAGVLFFTSADNPGRITQAKKIFKNAFIGFIIAITAWLVINTVLSIIFGNGPFSGGKWFSIPCATATRPVSNRIGDVISQLPVFSGGAIGGGSGNVDTTGTGGASNGGSDGSTRSLSSDGTSVDGYSNTGAMGSCGSGSYYLNGECYDSNGTLTNLNTSASYNNTLSTLSNICDTSGSQSACDAANNFADNGVLDAATRSVLNDSCSSGQSSTACDLIKSSTVLNSNVAGNSGAGTQQWAAQLQQACQTSGLTDCKLAQAIMANESSGRPGIVSGAGAVGLMQVMPSTARGLDPANLSGLSDAQIATKLINDPAYNMQLGTQYIQQLSNQFNGDPALIAAAYNGGAKANNTSSSCGGGTVWQCTLNSGYAETRVYVPRVLSTYNKL